MLKETNRVFADCSSMSEREWSDIEVREDLYKLCLGSILRIDLKSRPLAKETCRYIYEMSLRRAETVINGEGDK